ncbi:DNA polymerase III subunit alpha [Parvularcula dongshanensis]
MPASFIHLHCHSAFSLAEGAMPIGALRDVCVQAKMPALAVTDTNNLFGALEASEVLSGAGVQPITGMEVAVCPEDLGLDAGGHDGLPRVVLLAQDEAGYRRLMALGSQGYLNPAVEGQTCIHLADLLDETAGLLCLTGGPNGPLDRLYCVGRDAEAEALASRLEEAFPRRLYVEVQRHPSAETTDRAGRYPCEQRLLHLAYGRDLPIVATNNVYYAKPSDHEAHDALLCIANGAYISQDDRRRVSADHYFKSEAEMLALFADLPEACEATLEVAQRCAMRPRTHPPILPSFAGDLEGETKELERQAKEGLKKRLAAIELAGPEEDYWKRLELELSIIAKMGFPGYFLIVADFIQWAKSQSIPVGPGRGSGAGSLVAYALTITDLDPLRFGLLFERFLNPERISMPDFDVDFCQDRRDEVIAYVQRKYGHDRVAQIITFGKLQARAVLRDVGRVLQMPFGQVDRLCKMVPNNPANPVTLAQAIAGEPRLRQERDGDEQVAHLLSTALKLEGLYRHASTHAAGVVIGDRPLKELVPLYLDPRSDMPATQFNMKWVEPAGLVKFDFLGLKTLTVIRRAADLIGGDFDPAAIPMGCEATYDMLGKGDAVGVFQLESSGMRAALKGLNADCLEDIIALVSLYRPGPMDNIPTYIERKAGREAPDYLYPTLEPILKETHGVIIYQEQVMQIAQVLSGYSLGEADLLRRAMGKKKKEEMDLQRVRFVNGAKDNGVDPDKARSIFELVAKFAGYGFNKSHAAAYAWISYQTAWLKANHTAEFLAASMSLDMGLTDKLGGFLSEAKRCGVTVHPPCVNASGMDFTVKEGAIHYALGALKNVGTEAMRHVEEERRRGGPFRDLHDFAERIDGRRIGKRGFEQLARAGAFDALCPDRAVAFAAAEFLCRYSASHAEEKASAQGGLFGDAGPALARPPLPRAEPWVPLEKLDHELGSIGFYFSGHPLDDYDEVLGSKGVRPQAEVMQAAQGTKISCQMAGIVREVTPRRSKSGKPFAWITCSDRSGDFELTVFSEVLDAQRDLLVPGALLCFSVTAEDRDGTVRLTGEGARRLDGETASSTAALRITLDSPLALPALKRRLAVVSQQGGRGAARLLLSLRDAGCEVELALPDTVPATVAVKGAIKTIDGVCGVELVH